MSGSERLAEGVTLTIPNKVANSANSAQTFKVYNESEIIGSTSPEIRTVAKKKKWYQKLIMIIIIVILIIATIYTAGAASGAWGAAGAGAGAAGGTAAGGAAVAGGTAAGGAAAGGAVAGGAVAGGAAAGTVAVGTAAATTVAAASVGGGIFAAGSALGASLVTGMGLGYAGALAVAAGVGAATFAAASVLTQGLAIAAGLQESFSWKNVGKAAVGGAVSGAASFLTAGFAAGNAVANASRTTEIATRVGVETGRQLLTDGKISNVAGLIGAAAAGGAFSSWGTAGAFIGSNARSFGAGLSLLESKARGQGDNAMGWVGLATAALFDSGAVSPQLSNASGDLNYRLIALQAIGASVVSSRLGSEAGTSYFGNALGSEIVETIFGRAAAPDAMPGDRLGQFIEQNQPAWEQRQANVDQLVGAFSNPGQMDRSGDVLLAAGPGYSGMGGPGGKSQHEENMERMMRMANEPEAMGSTSAFRVEINGTSTTTSADVPMNAGSSSASMFPNSQVTGSGFTSDGRPYYDWDSGATTIGIPPGPDIVGTPLDALAVEGSGLRLGSLAQGRANGQAYYNGLIANADNPFTAIGATYGRAFSNAGYDLADGAAGLYALVTDSNVRAGALNAVGNALAHPLDTTAAAYSAGERYLISTSGGQIAEDVLRFAAAGVAGGMGVGRGATSLGGAAEAAGAAMKGSIGAEVNAAARASYLGDVYSPHFVGPVKFDSFYRGDAVQRSEFLSSMGSRDGLVKTESFLGSLDDVSIPIRLRNHSISSDGSAFISTTSDRRVAEYFARGERQDQLGWLTEFKVPAGNQASTFRYNEFSSFNDRPNRAIGLREQEYLVPGRIDPRYIGNQYQLGPR